MRAPNGACFATGRATSSSATRPSGSPAAPAVLLIMGPGHPRLIALARGLLRGAGLIRGFLRDPLTTTATSGARRKFFVGAAADAPASCLTRKVRQPAYTLGRHGRRRPPACSTPLRDRCRARGGRFDGRGMNRPGARGAGTPRRVLSLVFDHVDDRQPLEGPAGGCAFFPFLLRKPPAGRPRARIEGVMKLFRLVGSPGFPRDETNRAARDAGAELPKGAGDDPAGMARQLRRDRRLGRPDGRRAAGFNRGRTLVIHGDRRTAWWRVSGVAARRPARSRARRLMFDPRMGPRSPARRLARGSSTGFAEGNAGAWRARRRNRRPAFIKPSPARASAASRRTPSALGGDPGPAEQVGVELRAGFETGQVARSASHVGKPIPPWSWIAPRGGPSGPPRPYVRRAIAAALGAIRGAASDAHAPEVARR